jgi:hypothetical protein
METTTEEETLLTLEQYIAEHWTDGDDDAVAFGHYLYNIHEEQSALNTDDWESRYSDFRDYYMGCQPFVDYVAEMFTDCHDIPDYVQGYIDWESMARDWQLGGDYWTVADGLGNDYIFRSY